MIIDIGSDMNIKPTLLKGKPATPTEGTILLSTGRDCLEYIIRKLKIKRGEVVLLPAYLCQEIINVFLDHGINTRFYTINLNLTISPQDFIGELSKGDVRLALIINYFGWQDPGITEIKILCKKQEVTLVEDCAQSLLSTLPSYGDITFNSFRKLLPMVDGASLIGIKNSKIKVYESQNHKVFIKTRLKAMKLKNNIKNKKVWRGMFIKAEKLLVNDYKRPAPMSKESLIIFNNLDFDKIKQKRRNNYEFLAKHLKNIEGIRLIYPETIPKEITPSGLPIICKERDELKNKLIINNIYPPIHWELPTKIDKELYPGSYYLSSHILTLPIDQRYNLKDMRRIIKVIKE